MRIIAEARGLGAYRPARELISSCGGRYIVLPGKLTWNNADLSRKLRPVTDAERTLVGFDERRSMGHGPLSMCPEAGQRRIPTSRAKMGRVEQDQSRAESAGMGTRDDRDQAESAKSKDTEAEMQASSRATLTSRAQPEYRPCRGRIPTPWGNLVA